MRFYIVLLLLIPLTASAEPFKAYTPEEVKAETNFAVETVLESLDHPWAVAWLPTGEMLITERPGRLRMVRDGKLLPDPIAGVPAVLAHGQGGLLDVSLHPKFAENGFVYLSYAAGEPGGNHTVMGRGKLNGNALENFEVLFDGAELKTGGQHFGSRFLWLDDGTLLMSVGDGGNPPVMQHGKLIRFQAQNKAARLGKVLRMNDDGTPAADNPFIGESDAEPLVYSYGHRNIQGLAKDPLRNAVWGTEHGANGGDEMNRIVKGENYGWPLATFSVEYRTGKKISENTSLPGKADPVLWWPVCPAPSGLMLYTGDKFAAWKGDLFSGSLMFKDIRRIDLDDAGAVAGETSIPIGERVRDVRLGPDGHIYVLTDEDNGKLLRVVPKG